MYHFASTDLWQHLAALNAIIENPLHPPNPFVQTDDPSRLFGPYWVLVGTVCRLVGLTAPQGFVLGSIFNLAWLSLGIWILGNALHGGARGAVALLAAMLGGWMLGPNFTGFHDPLTLLSSAGYPAITALATSLMLWGLSMRQLRGNTRGVLIPVIVALAFVTHPLGTSVGMAGAAAIAVFTPDTDTSRRVKLLGLLALGLAGSIAWPYFNPFQVLGTAGSAQWGVGIDFYNPLWIAASLFPAVVGIPGLLVRSMRPFLVLLAICSAGFILGLTPYFTAGHRLLPFMVLILHIGLSSVLLQLFVARSPLAKIGQATALYIVVIQIWWTATKLDEMRAEERKNGNLLIAASLLTESTRGGFAGLSTASFPIAATGQRVLSTPFAEPLVRDMPQRQAATASLFDPSIDSFDRVARAKRVGVRYLVVDVRYSPAILRHHLAAGAIEAKRSGALTRYRLY